MGRAYQDSVVRAWLSSSLGMSQCRDPGIQTQSIHEDILDVIRLDRLQVPIQSSLGHNDDRLSFTDGPVRFEQVAHFRFPVVPLGWVLWDENEIGTGGDTC